MKTRTLAISLLSAALCTFPIAAQSSDDMEPGEGPGMQDSKAESRQEHARFEQELQLTPDQKDRLHKLHEEGKAKRQENAQKMKDVRQKIKEELSQQKPDAKKLMDYASQTAALVEQMTKYRIDHMLKIKTILTPEQYQKLLTREWRGEQRREMRKEHEELKHDGTTSQ